MRYIIIALVFIAFIGCNSSDNKNKKIVKESFPSNIEKDKTPPAIPEI